MNLKIKRILFERRLFLKIIKRRRKTDRQLRHLRRAKQGKPRFEASQITRRVQPVEFKAPENFSLLKNPAETIGFLNRIEGNRNARHPVFVNLGDIKDIDHAAIVLLLASMLKYQQDQLRFNGNFPKLERLKSFFRESRFLQRVNESKYSRPTYIENADHQIVTHSEKLWDPELIQLCISDVSRFLCGEKKRMPGLFRILTELQHNTQVHASKKREGEKDYWFSVNKNLSEKKVTFSFYDDGIGIFASLNNKRIGQRWAEWKEIYKRVLGGDPQKIQLKDLLEGDIHREIYRSRTGQKYRGKGLPAVNGTLEKGQICSLHVITDNRYADVRNGLYYDLPISLKGTLYFWEIDAQCIRKSND